MSGEDDELDGYIVIHPDDIVAGKVEAVRAALKAAARADPYAHVCPVCSALPVRQCAYESVVRENQPHEARKRVAIRAIDSEAIVAGLEQP
jgi:hypothetical protein